MRGYGAGAHKRSCGMEQTRLDDVGADDLGGPLYDPLPRQNGRFVNRPYKQTPTFAVGRVACARRVQIRNEE